MAGIAMSGSIRLRDDECGATAIEYSLIATFISIAAIFGMSALGINLAAMFNFLAQTLENGLQSVGLI